jgi:dipeptidyl-peptidase-4
MLRCLLLVAVCCTATAQKKPVTIEVAARPARTDAIGAPVWAPDGQSFIYTSGKAMWLYDVKARSKRVIGSLETLEKAAVRRMIGREPFGWENRRVHEEKIQWLPDGRSLLVAAEGDLFRWPLETSKWEALTATADAERDPKLSPDGSLVSFVRENELHVLDLATRTVRRLTNDSSETVWNGRLDWVYPEELDLGTAHWWSPDSKRIAFLQVDVGRVELYPHSHLLDRDALAEPQRYPKAGAPNPEVRLGFISASGGDAVWAGLGDPRHHLLARIDWRPDSKGVAVQRLNRVQNQLTLLFTDAANGSSRAVLTERDPHWVNLSHDLRFVATRDAFLWSSEESGFRHLYLYSTAGEKLKQLTSGEWEIKSVVAVDEERKLVYYHSRERSPLGADLYSVSLDGGSRKLLTPAQGQHSISMPRRAPAYFLDAFQSMTAPPRRTLYAIGGEQIEELQAPEAIAAEYEFIRPEVLRVKTGDGALLYARLTKPAGFDASKKYPAIVMVYGGPHAQNVCECYAGLTWEQALAQRGFVVWQLDNRGTAGRGKAFETKLFRRFGHQELMDQLHGIDHLVSLGFVDRRRIGMHGWSYGGFMTMYTALKAPNVLAAAAAGAPVTDWRNYDTIYTERYLGLPQENPEGYRLSSPLHFAENLNIPLMLLHNFEDDNVLFQQTMQMSAALQNAGKHFETVIYPQRTHGVTGKLKQHLYEAVTRFFEKHLIALH